MTRNIGDTVFSRQGQPAVILSRSEERGQLQLEREGENLKKTQSRGYINGLNNEEREKYNEIRDKVLETKDPMEKMGILKENLEELKSNPKNFKLAKYIEADLSHTMSSHGIHPNVYNVDEHHVR